MFLVTIRLLYPSPYPEQPQESLHLKRSQSGNKFPVLIYKVGSNQLRIRFSIPKTWIFSSPKIDFTVDYSTNKWLSSEVD